MAKMNERLPPEPMEQYSPEPAAISGIIAQPIGQEQVSQAEKTLQKYRTGKQNFDKRVVENDQWWRLRHWDVIGRKNDGSPEPASAWLFNSVTNKHGDAMDNYPEPVVLPRERSDENDAKMLSSILPVISEHNDFEATYSDAMWDKIKAGTSVYGVFWDPEAENGLGDISIRRANILNLFWQPGVQDIQESQNLFYCVAVDNDTLKAQHPEFDSLGAPVQGAEYIHEDNVDNTNRSMVVDWYYKKRLPSGKTAVHLCKYVGQTVLYASENDPEYQEGYYKHGLYPFVIDRMYPIEDSPAGFGFVDIMKSPQIYIDKLDAIVLENAAIAGKPRWFYRDACGVNQEEFADWSKNFVHVAGKMEDGDLKQITVDTLPAYLVNHMQTKIDELKETSGNRDFSQGGTASGVTAAAAIAALQEAGNKLSRDMLKGSYRAFRAIMSQVIELIRQFYNTQREFRIVGNRGQSEFVQYSNAGLQDQALAPAYQGQELEPGYNPAVRRPVFDVIVKAQKSNPFSQLSQNETAKELYQLGVFQPANADQALALLDMMEFEGKQKVEDRVAQNGTLYSQVMQYQQIIQKLTLVLQQKGIDLTPIASGMRQESQTAGTGEKSSGMGAAAKNAETMTPYGERLAENARASVSDQ